MITFGVCSHQMAWVGRDFCEGSRWEWKSGLLNCSVLANGDITEKTLMLQTGLPIVTSLLQELHCQHQDVFQVCLVPA